MKAYESCTLCPRECGVNRLKGDRGYCGESAQLRAGLAYLHQWEEPCISGSRGSGTVFFAGCSMGCVFCQNAGLSRSEQGVAIEEERLAEIFWELKDKGAHNINLVTASHFLPHVVKAIRKAKAEGFDLPFVYNCGGYEKVESLQMLDGLIDIYLPDFKYIKPETAERYSKAADYPEIAKKALLEMFRQVGPVQESDGLLKKGMVVRHLVMPEHIRETKQILKYLQEEYGDAIRISVMNQYTPTAGAAGYPEINRKLRRKEYRRVLDYLMEEEILNCYIQEGGTAEESFIPVFDGEGVV